MGNASVSAATATATTEVSTATSATAAKVGTATTSAMRREFGPAGVVSATHGASSALRVKIGSASRANFAKTGRALGTRIPFPRHRVLSDVPISALTYFATAVARGAIGSAVT